MKCFSSRVKPNWQAKKLSKQEQHEDPNFELVEQQSLSNFFRSIVHFTPLKVDLTKETFEISFFSSTHQQFESSAKYTGYIFVC